MIIHKGQSANSGHYMALVRLEPNKWYLFNDETTCPYVPYKATGGGSNRTPAGATKRFGSHKKRGGGGGGGCGRRGAGRPALITKRVPSNSLAAAADGALGGALRKAVVTDHESGELELVDVPEESTTPGTLHPHASPGAPADVAAVPLQDATEAVLRSKLVSEGCYMLVYKLRASAPSSPPPRSPGPSFGLGNRLSHEYPSSPTMPLSRSLSSSLKTSTIDDYRNGMGHTRYVTITTALCYFYPPR